MGFESAEEQLEEMQKCGIVRLDNLRDMAGKLPPTRSVGQSPENYYAVCKDGDLCSQLERALPSVPLMNFNTFAAQTVKPEPPDMSWLYNQDKSV